ncbi:MAG: hypothetical protein HYV90_04640 [Candidatus Woesebacteria bacterium]|nr:MAG: hypothetical protein HYV90_04640 [Candidatus Woesebacteria bacterium]
MTKFNSGKASVLALTSVFVVATFLLGKSLTSVFARAGDVPKAYCHAAGREETDHFNYHYNRAWTSHFYNNGTPKAGHEDDFYTVVGDRNCDGQADSSPTPTPTPTPTATPRECEEDEDECSTPTPEPTATPEITDACPNIEGIQDSIPEGYFLNSDDNCVEGEEPTPTPDADVCDNLDGVQTGLPEGMHFDAAGVNCVNFGQSGPAPRNDEGTGGQVLGASTVRGQVLGASTMAKTGSFEESLYIAIMGVGAIITTLGAKNLKKAFKAAN